MEIILNTNYKCRSLNESDSSIISHIDDRLDLLIRFFAMLYNLDF